MLSSPTAVKLLHRSFLENPMLIKKELFCKRNTVPLFTRPLELPFDSHYIFLNANSNKVFQSIRTTVHEKHALYEGAYISESDIARTA